MTPVEMIISKMNENRRDPDEFFLWLYQTADVLLEWEKDNSKA